jgi:hypothetical protein
MKASMSKDRKLHPWAILMACTYIFKKIFSLLSLEGKPEGAHDPHRPRIFVTVAKFST